MKKTQVIKYLKNISYKYYKNGDLINYQYINNCILVLKEGIAKHEKN